MNTRRIHFSWDHLDLLFFSSTKVTVKYPCNYAFSRLTVSNTGNFTLNRPLLNVPNTLGVRGLNKINNREYSDDFFLNRSVLGWGLIRIISRNKGGLPLVFTNKKVYLKQIL